MAMPTYGVTFLPQGDALYRKGDGGATGTAPLQEAVRVLSLRVPNVIGNNPMAPLALLNAPGGKDVPAGVLQQLLRQQGIMGQMPDPNAGMGEPAPKTGPDTMPAPSGGEIAPPPVSSASVAGVGSPGAAEAAPAPIGAATPLSSLLRSGSSSPVPSGVPTVRPTVTGGQTSAPLQPATPMLPLQPNQPVPAMPAPRVAPGSLPGQPAPEPPAPPPSPAPVLPPAPMPSPEPMLPPAPMPAPGPRPTPAIPGQEPIGAEQAPWKVVQELLRRLGGRQ